VWTGDAGFDDTQIGAASASVANGAASRATQKSGRAAVHALPQMDGAMCDLSDHTRDMHEEVRAISCARNLPFMYHIDGARHDQYRACNAPHSASSAATPAAEVSEYDVQAERAAGGRVCSSAKTHREMFLSISQLDGNNSVSDTESEQHSDGGEVHGEGAVESNAGAAGCSGEGSSVGGGRGRRKIRGVAMEVGRGRGRGRGRGVVGRGAGGAAVGAGGRGRGPGVGAVVESKDDDNNNDDNDDDVPSPPPSEDEDEAKVLTDSAAEGSAAAQVNAGGVASHFTHAPACSPAPALVRGGSGGRGKGGKRGGVKGSGGGGGGEAEKEKEEVGGVNAAKLRVFQAFLAHFDSNRTEIVEYAKV